jgi:hypothetical protein
VTSNISFSQINGTTSFSKSYITLCSASNGSFNFDLTDEVVDFLEHIDEVKPMLQARGAERLKRFSFEESAKEIIQLAERYQQK